MSAIVLLATFVVLCRSAVLVVNSMGTNTNFTTIQAAINSANVGDTVRVDNGVYNENISTMRAGVAFQEIEIEAKQYLGAKIVGSVLMQHAFVVLRGFTLELQATSTTPGLHVTQGNCTVEWCAINKATSSGTSSSLLSFSNAAGSVLRANKFGENNYGATNQAGGVVTINGGSNVRVIGNHFQDTLQNRSYDLKLVGVSNSQVLLNAVAAASRPSTFAALFVDCLDLVVQGNTFFAPIRVEAGNIALSRGISLLSNTYSQLSALDATRALIELVARGANRLNNVTIANSLLVECGETPLVCGTPTCTIDGSANGVGAVTIVNNTMGDEQFCDPIVLANGAANDVRANDYIGEPQAYSLDTTAGCNISPHGADINFKFMPFTSCRPPIVAILPFPYPTMPPTPPPTPLPTPMPPTVAMTTMSMIAGTLPPTPPPTMAPTETNFPTMPFEMMNDTSITTVVVELTTETMAAAPESVSAYVILIIVGPVILCYLIISIMAGVAFFVRRRKQKEMSETGGTRMDKVGTVGSFAL